MKPEKLSRDLLVLAILTVITTFTWISLDLYRVLTRPQAPQVPSSHLEPLNPKLETKIIDSLSQKPAFQKEEFIPIQILPTPGETETTESGQIEL